MIKTGKDFDLNNLEEIKKINSPKKSIKIFKVVYVDKEERWAVVAANWNKEPRLCMRWFWDTAGFPQSRGYGAWMVITPKLAEAILDKFLMNPKDKDKINQFIAGKIKGTEL